MSESKFRLGTPVPDFPVSVDVIAPGGEDLGRLTCTMRWRTRQELASMGDAPLVDALLELILKWTLDEPCDLASIRRLHDEYPFVTEQLWRAYLEAWNGVARKN